MTFNVRDFAGAEQFGLRVTEMLGDLNASEPVDGLPTEPAAPLGLPSIEG